MKERTVFCMRISNNSWWQNRSKAFDASIFLVELRNSNWFIFSAINLKNSKKNQICVCPYISTLDCVNICIEKELPWSAMLIAISTRATTSFVGDLGIQWINYRGRELNPRCYETSASRPTAHTTVPNCRLISELDFRAPVFLTNIIIFIA